MNSHVKSYPERYKAEQILAPWGSPTILCDVKLSMLQMSWLNQVHVLP